MLDKKINLSDFFYSSSEWVIKLQRQLAASTTHVASELLTKVQYSSGSRSPANETRALKMRSMKSGWPWQVDNNQLIESHHQS